jgi:DNA (cytosine-5)-methyltransferase 1
MQTFCKKNVKKLQKRFFPYICCMEKLRHGSLFSGIGGFDLAAEWMGWDNVFHCEWNEFGQKVLKHYWPQAETFTDITKTDFTKYYGKIDILTGGFPCQPYSSAGKRKGKEDERHLWPEMLRTIREVSPRFVVGENVRGLTNWNGGLVFEEVCAELENLGYSVAPVIIPACGVNAPHRRERVWFIAYAKERGKYGINGDNNRTEAENRPRHDKSNGFSKQRTITNADGAEQRNDNRTDNSEAEKIRRENESNVSRELSSYGNASNANGSPTKYTIQTRRNLPTSEISTRPTIQPQSLRLQESAKNGELERPRSKFASERTNWDQFPTQSPVCSRDDGFSSELDGITFPKWRNESIKAYGNAIVPQVAFQIFKALEKSLYLPR